jgi:hypothetical protein
MAEISVLRSHCPSKRNLWYRVWFRFRAELCRDCSSVGTIRTWVGRRTNRVSILGRGKWFFSLRYGIQKGPGADAACYLAGTGVLSTRVKGFDREYDHY